MVQNSEAAGKKGLGYLVYGVIVVVIIAALVLVLTSNHQASPASIVTATPNTTTLSQASHPSSAQFENVYAGRNLTINTFTVFVADFGQPNATGVSAVALNVYDGGVLTNTTYVGPGSTAEFTVAGSDLFVKVNQTTMGASAKTSWAGINLSVMAAPAAVSSNKTASVPVYTVDVGNNVTFGSWTIMVSDLGQPNLNGTTSASVNVYYNGTWEYTAQVWPGSGAKFTAGKNSVFVKVNQTFAGVFGYQKWAKLEIAASPVAASSWSNYTTPSTFQTVYLGSNLTLGLWAAALTEIEQPNSAGVSNALVSVYYGGVLVNTTQIGPGATANFTASGNFAYVHVNQTFFGLYAYQRWAKMNLSLASTNKAVYH